MKCLSVFKKSLILTGCLLLLCSFNPRKANAQADIGVLFVVHGGMTTYEVQYMWDAVVHQFSYDPNHSVYKLVIWDSSFWPLVLDPSFTEWALRFLRMYTFAYDRIGGLDPRPLVLIVAVCAANSFILPTHQVNAMLMTSGGYQNKDYFKAGGGMTVLFLLVVIAVFYLFYL